MTIEQKRGFIMVGMPGSGKSTASKKIREQYPDTAILSSDSIREELFGSSRYDTAGDDVIQKQRTVAHSVMYQRAIEMMQNDSRVIIDATHLHTEKRLATLTHLLEHVPAEILTYILLKTPHALIEQRMRAKQAELPDDTTADETFFEAWQRVTGYFQKRWEDGELSWPTQEEGITVATISPETGKYTVLR